MFITFGDGLFTVFHKLLNQGSILNLGRTRLHYLIKQEAGLNSQV